MNGKEDLLKYLDEKIRKLKEELDTYQALKQLIAAGVETPTQQPQDLDGLPWRPYREGGGEWIYQDEAPEELVSQLIKAGKPVRIGDHIYSIKSGSKGKTFISRRAEK